MLGFAPTAGAAIAASGAPAVPVFIAAVTGFGLTLGGSSVTTTHTATALVSGVGITAVINDTAIYSFMDADAPVSTAGLVTLATISGPIGTILGKYYNPPSLPIAVSLGTLNLSGYDYVAQASGFDLTLDVGAVYSASVYAAILDNHSQLANLSLGTATGVVANQAAVTGVGFTISGPTANAVATGNGAFQTEALAEIAVELGKLANTNVTTAIAGFDVSIVELGILANSNASSQITASFFIGTVSTNTAWTLNNSHPDIEVSLLATLSVGELANQSTSISLPGQSFALGFNGAVNNSSIQPMPGLSLALRGNQVTTQSFNTVPVALPALAVTANLAGTDIFAVEFANASANIAVTATAASEVLVLASAAAGVSTDAAALLGTIKHVDAPSAPPLFVYCANHSNMGMATSQAPSEKTSFVVTVAYASGGNKYFIDGVQQSVISLAPGATYTFDQSDGSNANHPLRFSKISNGTHNSGAEYLQDVLYVGTPGQAGSYTQIRVAEPIISDIRSNAVSQRVRPASATASTAVNSNAIAERLTVSFSTASASAAATSVAAARRARLTTAQAESAITGTATSRVFFGATAQASTIATANVFSSAIFSGQGLGSANLLSAVSASIDGDAWGNINTSDVDLWDDTSASSDVDPWTIISTTTTEPVNPWTII